MRISLTVEKASGKEKTVEAVYRVTGEAKGGNIRRESEFLKGVSILLTEANFRCRLF